MQSCIMPGLPTYLVQELNAGTVPQVSATSPHAAANSDTLYRPAIEADPWINTYCIIPNCQESTKIHYMRVSTVSV